MKPFKKKQGSTHSIMALNQRRAVTDLAATLAAQGDTAAAGLVERLAPLLEEGEEMPDVKLLFRLLGRHAKRAGEELDVADTGRWAAGMTLSALRLQCRQEKAALYAAAVKVRKTLVELYGSKRCRFQFGLAARTPRGAAELAEEVRRMVSRLASPDLKLPPPRLPGVKADPAGWAKELRPGLARLERLLAEMEQRRIAVGDEVIGREKALAACEETYLLVARTTEALFALAGEKELARRVRPKAPRRERNPVRKLLARPAAWLRAAAASLWRGLRSLWAHRPRRRQDLRQTALWRLAREQLRTRIA